jgi:predicted DNA-binding WGR domain protein
MITLDGKTTTVTFGKIAHGAAGTEQAPKAHESAAKARAFYDKQIAAKEKQGFTSLGLVPER